jgi:hypothetical protein
MIFVASLRVRMCCWSQAYESCALILPVWDNEQSRLGVGRTDGCAFLDIRGIEVAGEYG